MRWQLGRRSSNVEDRRGSGGMSRSAVGGGLGALLLALFVMLLGGDPTVVLQSGSPDPYDSPPAQVSPAQDQMADFISVVLADTEDTWRMLFQEQGGRYVEPRLVLFSGSVDSACGRAGASVGPFYCPGDQQVYIDLSFYDDLKNRLGAPGDFAQAYVIAHEVGHHVQNLLGISEQVQDLRQRVNREQGNQLSVMQELQADCFAGIWGYHAQAERQILEQGDVEEALNAAAAIGDDRLQRQSQGYVVPESFTHGTSQQRVRWFSTGLQSGDMNQCNTFQAAQL